ncbi:MAG: YbaB/EbfC family nucleoid-associated protein [Alphaproteobacteria bacterium]|nr:YbaB/EbfC family nucleoid-associated protein [Alphaproteobacteria bacterium]
MKNLTDMLRQAQGMQQRLQDIQAELAAREIEGRAGGGLVRVMLDGKGALKRLWIDPSLFKPEEATVVEDLVVAAHAEAKARMESAAQEAMSKLADGLPLPPGFKLPL